MIGSEIELDELRAQIDSIDTKIVELFNLRMNASRSISRIKNDARLPIENHAREEKVLEHVRSLVEDLTLKDELVAWYQELMNISKRHQEKSFLKKKD